MLCSTDGGKTLGSPLKQVIGDVGTKITGEIGKKVVWEVLAEREKLIGGVLFELWIKSTIAGAVTAVRLKTSFDLYKIKEIFCISVQIE